MHFESEEETILWLPAGGRVVRDLSSGPQDAPLLGRLISTAETSIQGQMTSMQPQGQSSSSHMALGLLPPSLQGGQAAKPVSAAFLKSLALEVNALSSTLDPQVDSVALPPPLLPPPPFLKKTQRAIERKQRRSEMRKEATRKRSEALKGHPKVLGAAQHLG